MIEITDLFCLYPSAHSTVAALRGLSLSVGQGERVVIHGPNGSGKSSLLKVLTGEVAPSAGAVRLAGTQLTDSRSAVALRLRTVGVVDQYAGRTLRPELDVLDNIGLQLRLAGVRRSQARDRAVGLLARLNLGWLADRRVAGLSGGEAQRVALCAALAHEPAVILADEPTGELDFASAEQVYDLIGEAAAGATLLLVTHDHRAARIADRVVTIRDGRLSEEWSPAEAEHSLVVDDRGWLRLPEALRRQAGAAVTATDQDGTIVLRPRVKVDSPAAELGAAAGPNEAVQPPQVVAELVGVSVSYGPRAVLSALDLTVESGRLTVVRGPSGAGKSTVLRLVLGLADPDAGSCRLAGVELVTLDRAGRAALRRGHVAVVAQSVALAESLDVAENLTLARALRGLAPDPAMIAATIDTLDLGRLARLPLRVLSGGERQRVAIARCLVVDRRLLVLDEPTSQQDEWHAELVTHALAAAVGAGTAVLAASHDPVLVTAAGQLLELGPAETPDPGSRIMPS